jgi:uncharacterized protein YdeI (YjbR/CyaY-like superfamily)
MAMKIKHFPDAKSFRAWLQKNHATAKELWVGLHRLGTGKRSITYPEALDEALCVGWIDGVRKSVRPGVYTIRFTPRRAKSNWSLVNIRRARELIKQGRMTPHGLRMFEARDETRAGRYSYEQKTCKLNRAQEKLFCQNLTAWQFFKAQAPSYQRMATWWIVSAVREETRNRRLLALIEICSAGRRLDVMTNKKNA